MISNILKRISKTAKTKTGRLLSAAALGTLLCCTPETQASGSPLQQSSNSHTEHQHSSPAQSAQKQKGDLNPAIPDVEVFNQDGKKIRFYSDLIKGKSVVISFVFTTCKLICPMQGDNVSKLQALLGDRLGKDVNIIFVSADPVTDTPERLKNWGAQFGAKQGWTFVTGDKSEIDKVALAFTGVVALKGEHSPVVFIGNDKTGIWIRTYGLAEPERFNKLIDQVTENHLSESSHY